MACRSAFRPRRRADPELLSVYAAKHVDPDFVPGHHRVRSARHRLDHGGELAADRRSERAGAGSEKGERSADRRSEDAGAGSGGAAGLGASHCCCCKKDRGDGAEECRAPAEARRVGGTASRRLHGHAGGAARRQRGGRAASRARNRGDEVERGGPAERSRAGDEGRHHRGGLLTSPARGGARLEADLSGRDLSSREVVGFTLPQRRC